VYPLFGRNTPSDCCADATRRAHDDSILSSQFGYVNPQNVLRTFATKTDQPPQNHRFEEMICAGIVHQTRPDDVIAACLSSPRVPLCSAAALRHP
jgi:hypothetical protein